MKSMQRLDDRWTVQSTRCRRTIIGQWRQKCGECGGGEYPRCRKKATSTSPVESVPAFARQGGGPIMLSSCQRSLAH